jgi:hypothetical protein
MMTHAMKNAIPGRQLIIQVALVAVEAAVVVRVVQPEVGQRQFSIQHQDILAAAAAAAYLLVVVVVMTVVAVVVLSQSHHRLHSQKKMFDIVRKAYLQRNSKKAPPTWRGFLIMFGI